MKEMKELEAEIKRLKQSEEKQENSHPEAFSPDERIKVIDVNKQMRYYIVLNRSHPIIYNTKEVLIEKNQFKVPIQSHDNKRIPFGKLNSKNVVAIVCSFLGSRDEISDFM